MKQDLHSQTDSTAISINPAPNTPAFWEVDVSPPGNCERQADRQTLLNKAAMRRFFVDPDCLRDFPSGKSGFFVSGYKQSAVSCQQSTSVSCQQSAKDRQPKADRCFIHPHVHNPASRPCGVLTQIFTCLGSSP